MFQFIFLIIDSETLKEVRGSYSFAPPKLNSICSQKNESPYVSREDNVQSLSSRLRLFRYS